MHYRFGAIEQHSYSSNIEIKGIPQQNYENLFTIVDDLAKKINFDVTYNDIKHIHRTTSSQNIRPIIVEFNSKFLKENFLLAFKTAELTQCSDFGYTTEGKITINNHLPPWKKKLLHDANQLKFTPFNLAFVWINHGKNFCKRFENSRSSQIGFFQELDHFNNSIKRNQSSRYTYWEPPI